ncbi:MAG: tetratricopeptide repeat protein [Candidatus Levyibacteriota bacterium]
MLYITLMFITVIPITFYSWYHREKNFLWYLPLWFLILFGFTSLRNTYYGYFALTLLLAWFFSSDLYKKLTAWKKYSLVALSFTLVVIVGGLLAQRLQTAGIYIPQEEVSFIKNSNLKGNMFNTYEYGGYLLYTLYPERKVFIDGRQDVYLCCEMPDYFVLDDSTSLSDTEFHARLTQLFEKYKIDYALLPTMTQLGLKAIKVLSTDNAWSLVFWNDHDAIYVRNASDNKNTLAQYSVTAATPLSNQPYREKLRDKALDEYLRMDAITNSALTKNNIGFIYLQQGNVEKAKSYLTEAVGINPSFASAYVNLATIANAQGNKQEAISQYKTALQYSPDRLDLYYQLAAVYFSAGDSTNARRMLEVGKDKSNTSQNKTVFENALNDLREKGD